MDAVSIRQSSVGTDILERKGTAASERPLDAAEDRTSLNPIVRKGEGMRQWRIR